MKAAVSQDSSEQQVQLTQTQCFFLQCVKKASFLLSQMREDHIVSISYTSTRSKKSNQHKNKQHISLSASLAVPSSSLPALKAVESQGKIFIILLLIGLRLEIGLYQAVSFLLAFQQMLDQLGSAFLDYLLISSPKEKEKKKTNKTKILMSSSCLTGNSYILPYSPR